MLQLRMQAYHAMSIVSCILSNAIFDFKLVFFIAIIDNLALGYGDSTIYVQRQISILYQWNIFILFF